MINLTVLAVLYRRGVVIVAMECCTLHSIMRKKAL